MPILAKQTTIDSQHPDLCNYQGIRMLAKGNPDHAKRLFDRAMLLCHKDDKLRRSACLNNMACYYKEINYINQALVLIKQSHRLAKSLYDGNPKQRAYQLALADAYINRGVLQSLNGYHRTSLVLFRKGMQLLHQMKDVLGDHQNVLTISLYNQAVELMHLKENHRAQPIFEEVRKRCEKGGLSHLPEMMAFEQKKTRMRRGSTRSRIGSVGQQVNKRTIESRKSAKRRERSMNVRDTLMPCENMYELNPL